MRGMEKEKEKGAEQKNDIIWRNRNKTLREDANDLNFHFNKTSQNL